MEFHVAHAVRRAVEQEALRAFPLEGCGFLVSAAEGRADEAIPRPNVHPGPRERRFLIDGLEYVRLEDELEASGRRLVGIFHSHPRHPAVPSETDREAAWPGLVYLIQEVAAADRLGALRAWRLGDDRRFEEVEVKAA